MKKNFRLAMLIALLLGFGLVSTSHGKASRQSDTIDGPVAKRLDGHKEEEEKPAADSTDSAKSPQANAGETSTTSKKTRTKKKTDSNEAAGTESSTSGQAPPGLHRVASRRARARAPGRRTARTRIPLQRQRASRRRALQLILRRARRRQPGTLPQPGKARPARQASRKSKSTSNDSGNTSSSATGNSTKEPTAAANSGNTTSARTKESSGRTIDRQHATIVQPLPALLTQGHRRRLRRRPATLATPPARGPHRSP